MDEYLSVTVSANPENEMKAKYGKVYALSQTIPLDDEHEREVGYYFKKPTAASYERYVKTMSQQGATKSGKAFLLDNVTDESREALTADLEEFPGLSLSMGNRLAEMLGLSNVTNLKLL